MALKTTTFITSKFDRCDYDRDWSLPEGHILYSWNWVDTGKGIELDRNEVLVEVQHGTLKDIAESIGVELHLSEDN
jgi:hypothetical protein